MYRDETSAVTSMARGESGASWVFIVCMWFKKCVVS